MVFQDILNNTFATCDYNKEGLYNFISIVDNKYIIFSNNFHIEIATLFYAKKRLLKKCIESINQQFYINILLSLSGYKYKF